MATVELNEVKGRLPEIISELCPGEQLIILENGEPVATLTRNRPIQSACVAGSAKGSKHWMAPDFDAPLEDFREYMQ